MAPTHLAVLSEDSWGNFACPLDQLDDGTILKLWANIVEGLESCKTWIRITQYTVTVTIMLDGYSNE